MLICGKAAKCLTEQRIKAPACCDAALPVLRLPVLLAQALALYCPSAAVGNLLASFQLDSKGLSSEASDFPLGTGSFCIIFLSCAGWCLFSQTDVL